MVSIGIAWSELNWLYSTGKDSNGEWCNRDFDVGNSQLTIDCLMDLNGFQRRSCGNVTGDIGARGLPKLQTSSTIQCVSLSLHCLLRSFFFLCIYSSLSSSICLSIYLSFFFFLLTIFPLRFYFCCWREALWWTPKEWNNWRSDSGPWKISSNFNVSSHWFSTMQKKKKKGRKKTLCKINRRFEIRRTKSGRWIISFLMTHLVNIYIFSSCLSLSLFLCLTDSFFFVSFLFQKLFLVVIGMNKALGGLRVYP